MRVVHLPLALMAVVIPLSGQSEVSRGERRTAQPPPTRSVDVVDVLHGVPVKDPFRWLEDHESVETRAWLAAQTAYTRTFLDAVPGRDRIRRIVEGFEKVDRVSVPFAAAGGRYVFSKRLATDAVAKWYVRNLAGEDRLLLAPEPQSAVSVNLHFYGLSADGQLLAYGVRRGGEDQTDMRFVDVTTGRQYADVLPRERYGSGYVLPDRSGVYYTRRRPSGTRILFHEFGTAVDADRELFGAGFDESWIIRVVFSEDARYAAGFVNEGAGTAAPARVYLMDRARGETFAPLVTDIRAHFSGFFGGGRLYLRTTWNAPKGRLLAVDLQNTAREYWREILPEQPEPLGPLVPAAGKLIVQAGPILTPRLDVFDSDGRRAGRIETPGIGGIYTVTSFGWKEPDVFYQFSSLGNPTIYRYDAATARQSVWFRTDVPIAVDDVETKQVWYPSKDGTRVPMFIIAKKGIRSDGDRPTILTGYGSYGSVTTPFYATFPAAWVQSGGVFASASIRGGGELGEAWHRAGMRANKQNTFDDFIAAAEWLIGNRYTRPERLAIAGGSAGGMLVAVAALQRPHLFRAVVCRYPHLDMLRYHKFLAAGPWVKEFGSPDVAEEFAYLRKFSPYHNVQDGERYPAMLFVTGDADTRVAPLHARKMTARMQAASASGRPVLLRYDMSSGHSGGSAAEQIQQTVDELAFLFWQLGLRPPSQ